MVSAPLPCHFFVLSSYVPLRMSFARYSVISSASCVDPETELSLCSGEASVYVSKLTCCPLLLRPADLPIFLCPSTSSADSPATPSNRNFKKMDVPMDTRPPRVGHNKWTRRSPSSPVGRTARRSPTRRKGTSNQEWSRPVRVPSRHEMSATVVESCSLMRSQVFALNYI